VGQLAAVLAEEEEEVLRAQVCEVMGDKVKVRFERSTFFNLAYCCVLCLSMSSVFCLKQYLHFVLIE
jgi:hypothetical protein